MCDDEDEDDGDRIIEQRRRSRITCSAYFVHLQSAESSLSRQYWGCGESSAVRKAASNLR